MRFERVSHGFKAFIFGKSRNFYNDWVFLPEKIPGGRFWRHFLKKHPARKPSNRFHKANRYSGARKTFKSITEPYRGLSGDFAIFLGRRIYNVCNENYYERNSMNKRLTKIRAFVRRHNEAVVVAVLATLAIHTQYKSIKSMNEYLVEKDLFDDYYAVD